MLSRWLIQANAATPVPPEASGQTLVLREEMALPTINASNLGTFTSVSTGEAWGQLPNGPTWLATAGDQSTRRNWSTAIRGKTAAEVSSAVTTFAARRNFTAATRGIISFWIRPGDFRPGSSSSVFFTLHTGVGDQNFQIVSASGSTTWNMPFSGTVSVNTPIVADEWYNVHFYWNSTDKTVAKVFDASGNVVYLNTTVTAFPVSVSGFSVTSYATGFQYNWSGRIGPISLYSVTNETDGVKQTSGMLPPNNEPIRWTILPDGVGATDYTTRTISGWAALATARARSVVSERFKGWQNTETLGDASYSTLTDSASKRAWWVDWDAGKRTATGDVCEFSAGVYRVSSNEFRSGRGVTYKNGPSVAAHAPELRCCESLTGTWSQPDAVNYPKVWQYDGATRVNRHVWGAAWQSFTPYSHTTDTLATNLTAINGREWACYTRPSTGVTYISLPVGTTPASIGPLEGSVGVGLQWGGSYVTGLCVCASASYDYSVGNGGSKALANYLLGVEHVENGITVVNNVKALRYAKHAHAVTASQADLFAIFKAMDVGYAPPANSGNFGVGTGDYTPLVDYNGLNTTVTPSKIVTIYDTVTEQNPTEPADGSAVAAASRRTMYYAHGEGAFTQVIALTVVKNPAAAMFTPENFNGSPVPGSHAALEVINPRP